jgi:hypothetical protein
MLGKSFYNPIRGLLVLNRCPAGSRWNVIMNQRNSHQLIVFFRKYWQRTINDGTTGQKNWKNPNRHSARVRRPGTALTNRRTTTAPPAQEIFDLIYITTMSTANIHGHTLTAKPNRLRSFGVSIDSKPQKSAKVFLR